MLSIRIPDPKYTGTPCGKYFNNGTLKMSRSGDKLVIDVSANGSPMRGHYMYSSDYRVQMDYAAARDMLREMVAGVRLRGVALPTANEHDEKPEHTYIYRDGPKYVFNIGDIRFVLTDNQAKKFERAIKSMKE
jgi:hypothetical protein